MRSLTFLTVLSALLGAQASPIDSRSENNDDKRKPTLPITRDGTQLKLGGKPWTASGANVYWLGLVSYSILLVNIIEHMLMH